MGRADCRGPGRRPRLAFCIGMSSPRTSSSVTTDSPPGRFRPGHAVGQRVAPGDQRLAALHGPQRARGQGERIDPRTDVFGLGAVLYFLLTGHPPYEGEDRNAVLELARQGRFPPPRQINPRVPRILERICLKAMAPAPAPVCHRRLVPAGVAAVPAGAKGDPGGGWRGPGSCIACRVDPSTEPSPATDSAVGD